jgi:hypothetical protein
MLSKPEDKFKRMLAAVFVLSLLPADAHRFATACSVAPRGSDEVAIVWGKSTTASHIRQLPSTNDLKQFYANWLKVRYGYQIAKFNAAYGTEFTSFTDLTESTFANLDAARKPIQADDAEFQPEMEAYVAATVKPGCPDYVKRVAWKRSKQ